MNIALQIKFTDLKENKTHGGILLPNGNIVCGCCGGVINHKDPYCKIVQIYSNWINLDTEICGDEECSWVEKFNENEFRMYNCE